MTRRLALLTCLFVLTACYTEEQLYGTELAVEGEYVLGMSDVATQATVEAFAEEHGLRLVEAREYDRVAVLVDPDQREQGDVLDVLLGSELADYAEPQYVYEVVRTPDDYGDYLWGLHNGGVNGGTAGADINAFDAWDVSTGTGVVIAVIDTGIEATHPDLVGNLWTNPGEIAGNGVDDDGNGYVDDVHGYDFVDDDGEPNDNEGHGTHVAGSAAARGDDGYGVPGVAFDARVMALKFLDGNRGGYSSMGAEAIHYAVNNGADVINASWGGFGQSTAIRNAIAYARSQGVIFVAAAGNAGNDNDGYGFYPAGYDLDNVISVAASDRSDRLADFSNYGSSSVDLAAPGVQIVSTWIGSDWTYLDGTSMASPYVAGVVALMKSARPGASVVELRSALLESAEPLASGGTRVASGGRLDAAGALALLLGGGTEEPEEPEEPGEPEEPEEPGPADWSYVEHVVESPHPYSDNFSGSALVEAPAGATEIRLHFDRIDTEANYDFVVVKDDDGNKLQEWTGDVGAATSDALPFGQVRVHLYTDYSVTGWGLKLAGYSWR